MKGSIHLMIQAYQGYFQEDGRFIPDGPPVKMPTKRRAIVNILDDEILSSEDTSRADTHKQKATTIKDIFADALDSEGALTDDEWSEMSNLRSQTNIGLSRTVDI